LQTRWKDLLWPQFGAAIEMLENAIEACPDALWGDRDREPEPWYLVYHTLFWLDMYLSDRPEGFHPPAPFNLDELDPAGVLPERVYSRVEMLEYLQHGRAKCRAALAALSDEKAMLEAPFEWVDATYAQLHLSNMRHVQHGAAQLNLLLRQEGGSAPRWVKKATQS
jgi:hypothetical protein